MSKQGEFFDEQYELEFDSTPVVRKQMLEEVVEAILGQIEQGADGKWIMPWSKTRGLPINAFTNYPYQGRNMLLLWASASRNNYKSNRWATFKQWQKMHAKVPRGYKATRIFRPIPDRDEPSENPAPPELRFRPLAVFNADQINRRHELQDDLFPLNSEFDEALARDLIAATGAEIRHQGSSAYYNHKTDEIFVPPRSAFEGSPTSSAAESYYSTLLHELVHWTGHVSRCGRVNAADRAAKAYAMEELVAEIGSALLCQNLGISPEIRLDHIQYIETWKAYLVDQPAALVEAAKNAVGAVKFLQLSVAQLRLEF